MPLIIPDRESIHDDFITDFSGAQPAKSVARGSIPWIIGRAASALAWSILAKLVYYARNLLPDTADAANLARWGTVFNFPQRGPVGSTGIAALQVSGTPGASVTTGSVLTHQDGTSYQVTTVGALVGGGGTVIVDVASISLGLATNKVTGETLTFSLPPSGVTAAAVLVADLKGGLDAETTEEYRARLLAHIGDPPEGGAIHDYVEWVLRIPGAESAYVWAHRRGAGTMDVAVLASGTGAARVPSAALATAVDDYIESVRPGNVRDFLVLTITPVTQDVQMTIDIDTTLYKWDWDDVGVGYTITAFDSTAKTITVPTAPAAVVAGVRLSVNGEEARVTSRVGSVLTLSFDTDHDGNTVSWFTFAISTGVDTIRASGDLVRPVRFAIMDLFNKLGPARSTWSATSWIDQLRVSKLYAAATDVAGVDDATITTPAANVSPTADAFGSSVALLVPGKIKVWKP